MSPNRSFLFSALLLLTLPLPGQEKGSSLDGPDRIRLANGEVLVGRILGETDRMVRIQLAKGMIIGLEKSRTVEIVRTSGLEEKPAGKDRAPRLLDPVSRHFLLLDREGKVVGGRHFLIREEALPRGGYLWRLEENWTFHRPGGDRLLVTRCEKVDPALEPLSCYYREFSAAGEKVVRGGVADGLLKLEILGPEGRRKSLLPFERGVRFPLVQRELLRRRDRAERKRIAVKVYDPMADAFRVMHFETGLRRCATRGPWGEWGTVFVLRESRNGRTHDEWLDGEGRTLYLEANGLDLAAVRCSPEVGRRLAEKGATPDLAPDLCRGEEARLRLPDPGWVFRDGRRLEAESQDLEARLSLLTLPPRSADLPLEEAARLLGRRYSLEGGELLDRVLGARREGITRLVTLQGRIGPKGGRRMIALVYHPSPGEPARALLLEGNHRKWKRARRCLEKVLPLALPDPAPVAAPE